MVLFVPVLWSKSVPGSTIRCAVRFGILLFVLVRYGLLAVASGTFAASLLASFVAMGDTSKWYAPMSIFAGLMLVALLLYAFRTAIGTRPLLKARLLPET